MSEDIFDKTIERFNFPPEKKQTKVKKKLATLENKKFKKWILSRTQKKELYNSVNNKRSVLQACVRWIVLSFFLIISITILFVGIIMIVAQFKESITTYYIPWIYAGAYIISLVLVSVPFLIFYKKKHQQEKIKKNDIIL